MISILEYYDKVNSVCSFWRGRGVLSELERQRKIKLKEANWQENWSEIRRHDIAFFQRPMSAFCANQISVCKDLGLKIWLDFDDYMFVPEEHPFYEAYTKLFDTEVFRKNLRAADLITVTNNEMLISYSLFEQSVKDKIVIIPNAINDFVLKPRSVSENKYILWRGGDNHVSDINTYIPDINDVMSEHKDWMFYAVGYDLKLEFPNYYYLGDFEIRAYFGLILNLRPSVFVAPLTPNKFNKCKSNIVWLEATLCGSTTVSPMWSEFQIGFRYGDFKQELLSSIEQTETRKQFREESLEYIRENLLLSNVNTQRLKLIKNL